MRPHNETVPPEVQVVRDALQEAAISVPQQKTIEGAREFLAALEAAQIAVEQFLAGPRGRYAVEEAMAAPDALDEAIQVLRSALGSAG